MGIEADISGVQGAGGDPGALAGPLRAARSVGDEATRERQAVCGLPVTGAALRTLQPAWFTEIGAHATVLEQLGAAMRDSTAICQSTRRGAAEDFGAVADHGQR